MDEYGLFDIEWPKMSQMTQENYEQMNIDDEILATLDFDELFGSSSNVGNSKEEQELSQPIDENINSRFKIASEEKLKDFEAKRHSNATIKNTKWAVKMFNDWSMQTRNFTVDWIRVTPEELSESLRSFYAETRPSSQTEEYHRNTMKNIRSGLNRHLRILGRHIDIVKDRSFRRANDLLNGKLKSNVMAGKSRPTQHKPIITRSDLEKIRDYLSHESPTCVQYKAWFNLAVHFVSRGLEFHAQLNSNSFVFSHDDEGREFVSIKHETLQKNAQGGLDDRESNMTDKRMYATNDQFCPVSNLKLLLSKLPPNAEKLFTYVKCNAVVSDPVWYSSKPLSQRQFRFIIERVSKEAGLSRTYTPHCVRATAIQALNDANVELRHIMYMSGHKNEASVRSYTRACTSFQKHELSSILNDLTGDTVSSHPSPRTPQSVVARREPSSTVSRPPATDIQNDVGPFQNMNPSLSMTMSNIGGPASGIMSRGSFHNCSFTFNVTNPKPTPLSDS